MQQTELTQCDQMVLPGFPESSKKPPKRKTFPRSHPDYSQAERQTIADHMVDITTGPLSYWTDPRQIGRLKDEADRFAKCGTRYAQFKCPNHDLAFRSPVSCNSRICERDCARRAAKIRPIIEAVFRPLFAKPVAGYGLKMLTLTTTTKRHGPDGPNRADFQRIYRESSDFFRLFYGKYHAKLNKDGKVIEDQRHYEYAAGRRGKKLSCAVRPIDDMNWVADWRRFRGCGYIASLEVGRENNMVHIHAIVYGPYISDAKLRETWLTITGDSKGVDVREVKNAKRAATYVLKYIIKPPNFDSYRDLAQYAVTIKGTRRLRTGGIFYNRFQVVKSKPLKANCPYCGGRLDYCGSDDILDPDHHDSELLFPLLREVRNRGSPLPAPAHSSTLVERADAEICQRAANLIGLLPN